MAISGQDIANDVDGIVTASRYQVDRRFDRSEEMVDNFYALLTAALGNLQTALQDIETRNVDVTIQSPGNPPTFGELRDRIPNMATIEAEILALIAAIEAIAPPTPPNLLEITPVDVIEPPDDTSQKPTVNIPKSPADFSEDQPELEQLNRIDIPNTLDSILAEDPSGLQPIITPKTINPPPNIITPEFIAELDISGITLPYKSFSYTEEPYTSTLKDRLQEYVIDVLNNGGTGVNSAVENALFSRNLERDLQAKADAKNAALTEWTKRGAEMLDDDAIDRVDRVELEFFTKRLDVSRDILIKAWDLEQANVFKSLDIGIGLETQLINLANSVAQRAFDALKAECDIQIAICDVEFKRFNMKLEEFKARFMIWETEYKSEMAKIEFYKAYLESMKLGVDIDQSQIDLFGKLIGIYQSRIDAAKSVIEAKLAEFEFEKTKLEKFKAETQAFIAMVGLKTAEYQWMQAQIAGEEAKVKLYATEIEGYKAQLEGIATKQGVGVENMKALIAYNDGLLKRQAGEVDVYKAQAEVGVQKAEVGIKGMAVEADVFKGIAMAYETLGNLAIKGYDANIQEAIAKAQLQLKNVEIEISNYEKMKILLIGTLDHTTQVLAQGVAGALAGTSVQASIHGSGSASEGLSYNYSETKKLADES